MKSQKGLKETSSVRKKRINSVALGGMFTALAVAISFAENLSGVNALIPIPGVKLGLANIAILGALICVGAGCAFATMAARCIITFLCFGNPVGFIISLCGGVMAVSSMWLVAKSGALEKFCTLAGISVVGAFFHVVGQLAAASVVTGLGEVMTLFPLIGLAAVATGIVTGTAANIIYVKTGGLAFISGGAA